MISKRKCILVFLLTVAVFGSGCVKTTGGHTVLPKAPDEVEVVQEPDALAQSNVNAHLDSAETAFVEGVRQYRAGRYESARSHLTDAIEQVISVDFLDVSEFDNRLKVFTQPEDTAGVPEDFVDDDTDVVLSLPETGRIAPVETVTDETMTDMADTTVAEDVEPVEDADSDDDVEAATLAEPEITYDLPVVINKYVEAEIARLQRGHDAFQAAIDRSGRYLPGIKAMLRHEGLPEDLAYLAMVESYYKPKAVSRVGAAGLWQFMERTGRHYGLERTLYLDERYDVEKATYAAISYLSYLHEMFKDDWLMALGSYNMGQGAMLLRAVLSTGTQDFWKLLDRNPARKYLPTETRQFVPRILAAIIISKEPEKYGFRPSNQLPVPVDTIPIEGYLKLSTIARLCDSSLEELRDLNPELRRDTTPPQKEPYVLNVPVGTRSTIEEALANLPKVDGVKSFSYRVKRGDTLGAIAARHGTTVEDIMVHNGLRNHIIGINQSLVIPVKGQDGTTVFAGADSLEISGDQEEVVHTIGRGDTLWEIAHVYETTVARLLELNGLSWSRARRLKLGRKLIVRRSDKLLAKKSSSSDPDSYIVRRGDSLWSIARKHGVAVDDIVRWNSLNGKTIHPGNKLVIGDGN